MPPVSASDGTISKRLPRRPSSPGCSTGLAQLSLVEHALCPLDTRVSLTDGFQYRTGYYYGPAGHRKFANVTVTAALGLSPNDELFLWGLLALTLAEQDTSVEFWATPYYCLRKLGYTDSSTSHGGSQYELFSESLRRLSHVIYHSNAFYNPIRREHLERTMGFLKYERPTDPNSSRQCRFVWDPLFLEFCRATGGGRLFFDLKLYRELDFASRRLFLLLHKLFGGTKPRLSPAYDVRHLAVNILGFAAQLPMYVLKFKLGRCIEKLVDLGAIGLPPGISNINGLYRKRGKGLHTISFTPGPYFTSGESLLNARSTTFMDSPLYDPLKAIGFGDGQIGRILKTYPKAKVQLWADITLRAMEGARGFPGFKKDPRAYFMHHIRLSVKNRITPPDWWHVAKKEEQRCRHEAHCQRQTINEEEWAAAHWQARHAAFEVYLSQHHQEFEQLVDTFTQVHSKSMFLEAAHDAAIVDARKVLQGRFSFPSEREWVSERLRVADTADCREHRS